MDVWAEVGKIVKFGGYDWQVLNVQDGKALIITDKITEQRAYNFKETTATWADCGLRQYLNGEFYNSFSKEEQVKIVPVLNKNLDNQWFGTDGGADTTDRIFLLSIEETVRYFGDSGQLKNKNPDCEYWIDDEYNAARLPKYWLDEDYVALLTARKNRKPPLLPLNLWYWLRSPGNVSYQAAIIYDVGYISLIGNWTLDEQGGVRPAMWVRAE